MNMCDCVKNRTNKEETEIIYKDRIVEKEVIKETPCCKSFMDHYGLPIGITVGSISTYILCNWKKIAKFTKSFV